MYALFSLWQAWTTHPTHHLPLGISQPIIAQQININNKAYRYEQHKKSHHVQIFFSTLPSLAIHLVDNLGWKTSCRSSFTCRLWSIGTTQYVVRAGILSFSFQWKISFRSSIFHRQYQLIPSNYMVLMRHPPYTVQLIFVCQLSNAYFQKRHCWYPHNKHIWIFLWGTWKSNMKNKIYIFALLHNLVNSLLSPHTQVSLFCNNKPNLLIYEVIYIQMF
jgi:hypothetical protein